MSHEPRRNNAAPDALDRRAFLTTGLVAGAAALAVPGCSTEQPAPRSTSKPETAPSFDLEEATIADLQRRMDSGQETARSLVEKYLARIDAIDKRGPVAQPGARDQPRRACDRRPARRRAEGQGAARAAPRHPGADQGQRRHRRPDDDDRRLAGARGLDSGEGLVRRAPAPRGGRRHPRQDQPERVGQLPIDALDERLERAVAASAGIRTRSTATRRARAPGRAPPSRPASRPSPSAPRPTARSCRRRTTTALVGIKPTLGLVSRAGIIPIAHSQDTAGPDGAHGRRMPPSCSAAIVGRRSRRPDHAGRRGEGGCATTRRSSIRTALKGARIGVPRKGLFGQSAAADRAGRGGDRRDEAARRGDRRPRRHRDRRRARQERVRGAALRVQGRPERLPRAAGAEGAGALARRRRSSSTSSTRTARCRTSARRSSSRRRRRGR